MSVVQLSEICLCYGKVEVLQNVDLSIELGEYVVILGASGCGKTSLLRIVAGLIRPTSGTVMFDGADVDRVAPRNRDVALVPQHAGLYPHLSIGHSIRLGIREKLSSADRQRRVLEAAKTVELDSFLERLPEQLSGGQLRRAAVAKAIASQSRIRLLDEPLSAIDANLRFQIERDLARLHAETPGVTIHVTHDGEEARRMADRVAVIENGKIAQFDTPRRLLECPISPGVAAAFGSSSLVTVRMRRCEDHWSSEDGIKTKGPTASDSETATLAYFEADAIEIEGRDDRDTEGWSDRQRNVWVPSSKLLWFLD